MKALVKYEKGKGFLEVREVEEPQVSGDMVKIRVAYAGICGTDTGYCTSACGGGR